MQLTSEKEFKQLLTREREQWDQRFADKNQEIQQLKQELDRYSSINCVLLFTHNQPHYPLIIHFISWDNFLFFAYQS